MSASSNAYAPPKAQVELQAPTGPVTDNEEILGVFPLIQSKMWSEPTAFDGYVGADRLVGVKTGGQLAVTGTTAVTVQFGLLGLLIGYFLKKRLDKKIAAAREDRRSFSLTQLLTVDPKNFEVRFSTVQQAHLKKPGFWRGGFAARLELFVGNPKPTVLFLKDKQALGSCRAALGKVPGLPLQIDPRLKFN